MNTIKRRHILLFVSQFLLLSFLAACGSPEENTQPQPDTPAQTEDDLPAEEDPYSYGILNAGDTAPDFTVSLADGTEFSLSAQQGKIVLLNFWATWCGPCVREMPAFEKLQEEYGEDVAILAVNCMEDAGIVDAFLEETGYTFPVAYDAEGSVIMKYPSQGIPYTLIIDAEGIIQKIYVGAADADTQYQEYKRAIDAIAEDTP